MPIIKNRRRIDPERVILTPDQVRDMEESRRFYNLLQQWPLVTVMLLAVIISFWILSMIVGVRSDPEVLVRMGAKINFLIDEGQWWRLVSPIFLHFGFLHIMFNGYALYLLGRMIENLYGHRRFLLLFAFSGVASIVASYFASNHMSVGASGAIFGLLGAGAIVGFKNRDDIPPVFRRFFGKGLIPWIILNLALGLMIDGIDNYAHVGGLVAGVLLTLNMRARIGKPKPDSLLKSLALSAVALAVLVLFVFTIAKMLSNIFIDDALPKPDTWIPFRNDMARVAGEVPDQLFSVENSEIEYGGQWVERRLGYWVAIEREPDVHVSLESLADHLRDEVRTTTGVDQESVVFLRDEKAILGGYTARRIGLEFRLTGQELPYELDVWLLPTSTGLVSATCSAPKMFYASFRRWCSGYISSLRVLD